MGLQHLCTKSAIGLKRFAKKSQTLKPLSVFQEEAASESLNRQYGLWSLMAIGVGGTVGSGVFVMSGQIAATMAGPATTISWLIAGFISAVTALAYCELAAILQAPGTTYAFSYFGLGEALAVISAFLVTLEYGISGAAVARSWGDKLSYWLNQNQWATCANMDTDCWVNAVGGTPFNPSALFISTVMVLLILRGVSVERTAVNILVTIKVALVLFVIICGAVYVDTSNWTPFVPAPGENDATGGFSGVLMGATSAFFGYIGFDEVTCMSGEAKNPKRDIPIAVMGTIAVISLIYAFSSLVLTGMMPYYEINQNEGFGSAFMHVGAPWAMQITLVGEILFVLPTVVLVCYIPQSRILYAVAVDKQMPKLFAQVKPDGSLFMGSLISGVLMTLIAAFVPFAQLNDLISGGILFSFILTNCSLVLTRTRQQGKTSLFSYVIATGLICFLLNKTDVSTNNMPALVITILVAIGAVVALGLLVFQNSFTFEYDSFAVPLVPFIPAVAIFLNWYLFTQLTWLGIIEVAALVLFAFLVYVMYGYRHGVDFSVIGENDADSDKMDLDDGTVNPAFSSESDRGEERQESLQKSDKYVMPQVV